MNTLFLRLEGPLQSWGIRSRWGERDTADAPSKSGVIGLLGCALGYRRDDDRLRMLSETLRFGVRIDRPGQLLVDYHTTGGGTFGKNRHDGTGKRYADEPYVGGVPSAEVKQGHVLIKITQSSKEPETDTSNRFYLMDASFLAVLQGDAEFAVEALADALNNPAWPYYLGRKACVPTQPVFEALGQFPDLETALRSRPLPEWLRDRAAPPLRALVEVGPGKGNRQNDNIVMSARRIFGPRYVREVEPPVLPPGPSGEGHINTLEG